MCEGGVCCWQYFPEMCACLCVWYLFYSGDSDNKEEGQAAGDWACGGVDDKLQRDSGREVGGGVGRDIERRRERNAE